MKLIVFIVLITALYACNQHTNTTQIKKDKKTSAPETSCLYEGWKATFVTNNHSPIDVFAETDSEPQCGTIDFDLRKKRPYTCAFTKSDVEILHDLLPGKMYKGANGTGDTILMNLWVSPKTTCEPVKYFGEKQENTFFPDSMINNSLVDTSFMLLHKGITYKIISFYTASEYAPSFTGRYSGANTGLIVLRKRKQAFTLEVFTVYLGNYGAFQIAPVPECTFVNDMLFVRYAFNNGGPGEPYSEFSELFKLDKGVFSRVDEEYFTQLFNTPYGGFTTQYFFESNNTLILKSTGVINPSVVKSDYSWVMDNAPVEVKNALDKVKNDTNCYTFGFTRIKKMENGFFKTIETKDIVLKRK